MLPIISSSELREINKAIENGLDSLEISLDLGISKTKVKLEKKAFIINDQIIKTKKIKEDDKSLLDLINIENTLSDKFGIKVDLVTEGSMSPYIKPYILKDLKVILNS